MCKPTGYYLKPCKNVFWDGYVGQQKVIMDEVGKRPTCIWDLVKLWANYNLDNFTMQFKL